MPSKANNKPAKKHGPGAVILNGPPPDKSISLPPDVKEAILNCGMAIMRRLAREDHEAEMAARRALKQNNPDGHKQLT